MFCRRIVRSRSSRFLSSVVSGACSAPAPCATLGYAACHCSALPSRCCLICLRGGAVADPESAAANSARLPLLLLLRPAMLLLPLLTRFEFPDPPPYLSLCSCSTCASVQRCCSLSADCPQYAEIMQTFKSEVGAWLDMSFVEAAKSHRALALIRPRSFFPSLRPCVYLPRCSHSRRFCSLRLPQLAPPTPFRQSNGKTPTLSVFVLLMRTCR